MRGYLLAFLSGLLIAVSTGCKKKETTQRVSNAKQESNQPAFDVCALITKQEIETVQGSAVKETKSSLRSDAGFRVSQCVYTAENYSKSVSLAVTERDPTSSGNRSVKDFWNETFGRSTDADTKSTSDEERKSLPEQAHREGEETTFMPPKRIDGLGDDAFWSPNPTGGAIYVLKRDVFIRLSIGGRDDEQAKLDKSRTLAQKAIDRL